MSELAERTCTPCRGGTPPLRGAAVAQLRAQLHEDWRVVEEHHEEHHLERTFRFPDFRQALELTVRVGELAEEQQHHPDLHLSWGKVVVEIWTHKIGGLSEADFVFAAKTDLLARPTAGVSG